jgi:RHS repeat-associated protein
VVNKFAFSPFGETGSISASGFGYTGQRYDAEIGLYNYKARYYAPAIGRFLQPDPIGTAGGMNLYSYVGNDAVNLTDALGLEAGLGGSGQQGTYVVDWINPLNWFTQPAYGATDNGRRPVDWNLSGKNSVTTAPSSVTSISTEGHRGYLTDANQWLGFAEGNRLSILNLSRMVDSPLAELLACHSAEAAPGSAPWTSTAGKLAQASGSWVVGYQGNVSYESDLSYRMNWITQERIPTRAVLFDPYGNPVTSFSTPMAQASWAQAQAYATSKLFD